MNFRGKAWQDVAGHSMAVWGTAGRGAAVLGMAEFGGARQGEEPHP